jgi:hypothetical protein
MRFGLRRRPAPHFCEARFLAPTRSYLPVPVRYDVRGLLLRLSLTLNLPVLVPIALGVNFTLTVHLLLAARLVPHVVADSAKSPVVEIAMLVSAMD